MTLFRAFAAGVVIVVAACASACRNDPPRPVAPPPAAEVTWREIGTWSGRLSQQTGSFEVSTVPMRLRWQTTKETSPGAGHLTVTSRPQSAHRTGPSARRPSR